MAEPQETPLPGRKDAARRFVALPLTALVLLSAAAPATAADSGIKGRVLDATCLGPCAPASQGPRPYGGEATIVVRSDENGDRVAADEVDHSRFRAGLAPGDYRVRVKIEDPCWVEQKREVTVPAGEFVRVTFTVANGCIQ